MDGRHGGKVALEAPGIEHLRHEQNIRQSDVVTMAETAGGGVARQHGLDGAQPDIDPVPVPGVLGVFIHAHDMLQVLEHAQVVERVNVAGNGLCDGTNARPPGCVGRQQRRLRMCLFQVFQNGHGLTDGQFAIHQRRHQRRGVQRLVVGRILLPPVLEEVHGHGFIGQTLEVESNAYAVGSRAAEITVELHQDTSLSLRDNSRGRGNATFSSAPSMVRTEMAPSSLSRAMTWLTRISGADAPAVTPTRLLSPSHWGSIISGPSTRCACTPMRSATSRSRLELEELALPTTSTRSH